MVVVSVVVQASGVRSTGAVANLAEGGLGAEGDAGAGVGTTSTSGCSAFQSTLIKIQKMKIEELRFCYSSGGARRSSGGYKMA